MAEVAISAPPLGVYNWRTPFRLDGVSGSLLWAWNTAGVRTFSGFVPCWTLYVYDSAGEVLAGPIPVTAASSDLWGSWHYLDIPPGRLLCRSDENLPGRDAFQDGAALVYETVG